MGSWLTTRKMHPDLRARIEASVRGARSRGHRVSPRKVMSLRLLAVAVVVATLGWLGVTKRQVDRELQSARADLLQRWQSSAEGLVEPSRTLTPKVQGWLERLTGPYPGDLVSPNDRGARGLEATLSRPMVYVRGSIDALASSQGMRASAAESTKDAFVLCLLDPPENRDEKAVMSRVRAAYAGSERMQRSTRRVERLGTALVGLPTLLPSFRNGIVEADDRFELQRYERAFEAAPLEATKRALEAPLLLIVIDEPGDPKAPAELDGERAHPVRVGLVDLTLKKVLLRQRRKVDPSWLSAARRPEYAREADGCRLALDVRQAALES
jgi:hypothetical protein